MQRISIEKMPSVEKENLKHLTRYVNFINSRPERKLHQKGFDTHHIYPKSIAKKNNIKDYNGIWNLIELTHREHFIAHLILYKCGYSEMISAFNMMLNFNKSNFYSRLYAKVREANAKKFHYFYLDHSSVNKGRKFSESTKNKIKEMASNRCWITNNLTGESYRVKKSNINNYDKNLYSYGMNLDVKGNKNGMYGKHHSNSSKKVMRDKALLRKKSYWLNNGTINKYTRNKDEIDKLLSQGYTYGRKFKSDTTKGRIQVNDGYTNHVIDLKYLKDYLDNGYHRGRLFTYGYKSPVKDKICITKDNVNKRVDKSKLDYYLASGWKKGMTVSNKKNLIGINNGIRNIFVNKDLLDNYLSKDWKIGRIKK